MRSRKYFSLNCLIKDLIVFQIFDLFDIPFFLHFKKLYLVGKWDDGSNVYISQKIVINVLLKHYINEKRKSFKIIDIFDLYNILNYSFLFKDEKFPNSCNLNFFSRPTRRDGYYDCLMKKENNNFYIFHFMYIGEKSFEREYKRKINNHLAIKINIKK